MSLCDNNNMGYPVAGIIGCKKKVDPPGSLEICQDLRQASLVCEICVFIFAV